MLFRSVSIHDYARKPPAVEAGAAVLYDHDHTPMTYATAEALAERYDRVVLLTPRTQIAQAVNYCSAIGIHRRLHVRGVEIVTAARPLAYQNRSVRYVDVFSQRVSTIDGVGILVFATPRRVNDALASSLGGIELHLIGDCMAPRNLMIAIHEGHAIGNAL